MSVAQQPCPRCEGLAVLDKHNVGLIEQCIFIAQWVCINCGWRASLAPQMVAPPKPERAKPVMRNLRSLMARSMGGEGI